ncbi:MAG: ester cyclase [Gemmatimonadota bacterium]
MKDTELNKDLVRRFVVAINDRNLEALGETVAVDFVRHCQATPDVEVRSLEDLRRFIELDSVTFPDSLVTIDQLVAEDNLVGFFARYEGTQHGPMGPFPPSDRRASIDFGGVFRMETGKIAELWVTWDNVAMLSQLGHLDPADL